MKRSKITAVALLMSMFAIGQVAVGQMNSPQPNATSGNNATPAGPTRAPQQKQQRQERQQRGRNQQSQSSRSQPMQQQLQQQQIARVQPQQQLQQPEEPQPEIPVMQHSQSQPDQKPKQLHARRSHPSHAVPASVLSYSTALEHCQRDRHPNVWWNQHYAVIVYSVGGYYYFDSGYWYPALGYSPNYEAYDYDGPIYTYGNLLPDQVILNVQRALKDLGYYEGALSGSLSPATRYAISAYQEDNGLTVNGVVDAPLVYSLGLQ